MDFLLDKDVKIRKTQKCFGCAREFFKGSPLRFIKSVDNGEFSSSYWCKTCCNYWNKYMEYGDEISFGDLRLQDKEGWEAVRLESEGTA